MGNVLLLAQRSPAGNVTLIGPDGRKDSRDTVQCAHCGGHWVPEPGSGRRRGWCFRHAGPLCGARRCFEVCASQEELCERIERAARMDANLRAIAGG